MTLSLRAHEAGAQVNANDATGWEALADHYEEHDLPGASFLREHAKHLRDQHPLLGSHDGPKRSYRDLVLSNRVYSTMYTQHLIESPTHEIHTRMRGPDSTPLWPADMDRYLPRVVAVKRLGTNSFPIHVSATPENVEALANDMGPHDGEVLRRMVRSAYSTPTKLARIDPPGGPLGPQSVLVKVPVPQPVGGGVKKDDDDDQTIPRTPAVPKAASTPTFFLPG